VTKNIFSFFTADILAKGISAVLIPVYSYLMGPAELGLFSEWFTLYNSVVALVSFGIPTYLLVQLNAHPKDEDEVINTTATLFYEWQFIGIPVILLVFAINNKFLYGVTIIMAAVSFSIVNYLEAYLRFNNKLKQYIILQAASTSSTNIIPLIFVAVSASWWSRSLGVTISVIILAIIILTKILHRYSYVKLTKTFRYDAMKFGFPVVLISVISWVKLGIDVQLLKGISGYKESGILFFSFQIISIVSILAASLNRASTPDFLRMLSAKNHRLFLSMFLKMTLVLTLFTLAVVAGSIILVKTFLPDFNSSVYLILPMAIGTIFYGAAQFISVVFLFDRKTYLLTLSIYASSLIHPLISYYIIGKYGWLNIGYSYLISYSLFLILVVFLTQKFTNFSFTAKAHVDG